MNSTRPYRTVIPVMIPMEKLGSWGEEYARLARETGAGLFVILRNMFGDREGFLREIDEFREKVRFFKERGITVGAWLCPTTGHEGKGLFIGEEGGKFTRRKVAVFSGDTVSLKENAFCPLDENFVRDFAWKMGLLSQTGADRSLFEDDLRLSGPPITQIACCCPLHMAAFSKKMGREVKVEELNDLLYHNEDIAPRKAWMEVKRETMNSFLAALRAEVDRVNPDFRIGISASRLNYDIDGATIQEMAQTAAGGTKPFVRLTGAPYWARENHTLSSVIESNRMQFGWFKDSGIEILSEGDPYPRPRLRLPAAYLEVFDQILRADGGSDGIYKYMTAYKEGPGYEDGYIRCHQKNRQLYDLIDRLFAGKKAVGLNVAVHQQKLADAVFDDLAPFDEFGSYYRLDSVIPPESCLVTAASVPTAYEDGDGAVLAFGENARWLREEQLNRGVITDIKGAKILMEKGVDVGLAGYERTNANPAEEYFPAEDIAVAIGQPSPFPLRFYRTELRAEAQTVSLFRYSDDMPQFGAYKADFFEDFDKSDFPSCYLYENEKGQRFCVYTFAAVNVVNRDVYNAFSGDFFASYERQRQIFDCVRWLQGRKLPAMSLKNPYLYILCKEDEGSRVIGLWNLWEDEIAEPVIELDAPAAQVRFYGTEGYIEGSTVRLTCPLKPYECAFVEIPSL